MFKKRNCYRKRTWFETVGQSAHFSLQRDRTFLLYIDGQHYGPGSTCTSGWEQQGQGVRHRQAAVSESDCQLRPASRRGNTHLASQNANTLWNYEKYNLLAVSTVWFCDKKTQQIVSHKKENSTMGTNIANAGEQTIWLSWESKFSDSKITSRRE